MSAQHRIIDLVEVLAKSGRDGMANKDLCAALKLSATTVCRDLDVLKDGGWMERTFDGNARLTPQFANCANLMARSFQEAKLRLSADEERYRSAMQ